MTDTNGMQNGDDSFMPVELKTIIGQHPSRRFGYYSVKELAEVIGFNQDTVYKWISQKGMPVRRSGFKGRITVHWPEFIKWWSRKIENAG